MPRALTLNNTQRRDRACLQGNVWRLVPAWRPVRRAIGHDSCSYLRTGLRLTGVLQELHGKDRVGRLSANLKHHAKYPAEGQEEHE